MQLHLHLQYNKHRAQGWWNRAWRCTRISHCIFQHYRPLLPCQHCCFYTHILSYSRLWFRTGAVGVPRVMQQICQFVSWISFMNFLLTVGFVQSNFRTGGCRRPFVQRLWATYYTRDKLEPPSEALPSLRRIQAWLIGDLSSRKWRRCFQRTRNLLRQAIITRFLTVSSKKNVLWGRPNVALFRVSSLLNSGISIYIASGDTLYPRVMASVQIRRLCTSGVRCAGWRFWRRSQTVIQTDEEAARY